MNSLALSLCELLSLCILSPLWLFWNGNITLLSQLWWSVRDDSSVERRIPDVCCFTSTNLKNIFQVERMMKHDYETFFSRNFNPQQFKQNSYRACFLLTGHKNIKRLRNWITSFFKYIVGIYLKQQQLHHRQHNCSWVKLVLNYTDWLQLCNVRCKMVSVVR